MDVMQRLDGAIGRTVQNAVVTIGNFDGVHLGHQALIERGTELSRHLGGELVVVTFDPHPRSVLGSAKGRFVISPLDLKLERLAELGVEYVKVMPFTRPFAETPAQTFMNEELDGRLPVRWVVVGENFAFGKGGQGTPALLAHWGMARGIGVSVVPPKRDREGKPISSTRVRQAIQQGDFEGAEALLGTSFRVRAQVASGAGRGSQMGVATANLEVADDWLMPPYGIYAGSVARQGGEAGLAAVASWGLRPTFGDLDRPLLEVHVIENELQLRGEMLTFSFIRRLREERRYDRVDDLIRQMGDDIANAKAVWLAKANG